MDWLPPIEVSRISDGGKVRPQKELFLIQSDYSVRYGSFFSFCLSLNIDFQFLILLPSFIELEESIAPYALHERTLYNFSFASGRMNTKGEIHLHKKIGHE